MCQSLANKGPQRFFAFGGVLAVYTVWCGLYGFIYKRVKR
jgi:hypothetical protein